MECNRPDFAHADFRKRCLAVFIALRRGLKPCLHGLSVANLANGPGCKKLASWVEVGATTNRVSYAQTLIEFARFLHKDFKGYARNSLRLDRVHGTSWARAVRNALAGDKDLVCLASYPDVATRVIVNTLVETCGYPRTWEMDTSQNMLWKVLSIGCTGFQKREHVSKWIHAMALMQEHPRLDTLSAEALRKRNFESFICEANLPLYERKLMGALLVEPSELPLVLTDPKVGWVAQCLLGKS